MPDKKAHPVGRKKGTIAGGFARAIVWLRFLILPAWIAVAVLASGQLPSIFNSDSAQLGSLLPRSSEAVKVETEAIKSFGLPLLSRTIVVARQPTGLSPVQEEAATRYISAIDRRGARGAVHAIPLLNAPGVLHSRDPGTTLVVFLYIDPSLSESEADHLATSFAGGLRRATGIAVAEVTGALPASAAETSIAQSDMLWVELATVLLVAGVLAFFFRSAGIPLLGLASVAIAYQLTDHVLGWISERYGLEIPREVDPVVIALLFGTLTDYLVFFVSEYRRRLLEGDRSHQAATGATAELLPVILTAALMIAGATLTLLISGVRFLSAFGPGMAVAVLIGAAVAISLVPCALAVFGHLLLWPWRPTEARRKAAAEAASNRRGRLVGFAARRPLIVAICCLGVLGAAASGLGEIALGNPLIRGLPDSSSPKRGYQLLAGSVGPGVEGPTMLVLEGPDVAGQAAPLAQLQRSLAREPGVSAVLGPASQPLQNRYGVFLAPNGTAARYLIVLDGDPDGATAVAALANLEAALPGMLNRVGLPASTAVGVTGDTTIATELVEETWRALARVAPAAIFVLILMLWILLGSWVAPLYLVGVSLLTVAAALGLTVYVFQGLLGDGELAFFVPVATAVVLLALGADYNVFLISRIWREAERQDLRPAIQTAGSRAARAITVAGVILALSFAAVALIPIESFREMAFAISVGLLLDTLIARTMLIPALVSLFGRGAAPAREPDQKAAIGSQFPQRRGETT